MDMEGMLRKKKGRTFIKPEPMSLDATIVGDFTEASREPPTYRTRGALRDYLYYRNRRRFNRLEKEFAWAKGELERINCNPEDLRFLL